MATTNNTAAVETTEQQAPAKSKVAYARELWAEIYTPGYKFKIEGAKSHRNEFIKRAINEFGMTQNGAATYFQNLSNAAKGEPLYKYSKGKGKKTTKAETADATGTLEQTTAEAGKGLVEEANNDKTSGEGVIGKFRWMVTNAAGEELSSWPIRSTAQAEAKKIGAEWADRTKLPAPETKAE